MKHLLIISALLSLVSCGSKSDSEASGHSPQTEAVPTENYVDTMTLRLVYFNR